MQRLILLYKKLFGDARLKVKKLTGGGSSRTYYRMSARYDASVIGTIGSDIRENEAFIALDKFYLRNHLPVPEVLAVSDDKSCYIQQNLGDVSLYDEISKSGVNAPEVRKLLSQTMGMLAEFHAVGADGFDLSYCYPRPAMDRQAVEWDLNYFKYDFLKLTGITFDEQKLQDAIDFFGEMINAVGINTLVLRDFQSRNVMIYSGRPYVIDFQGARLGNGLYDVASFLWQARIALPDSEKWTLAEEYVAAASNRGLSYGEDWAASLRIMALFRMLQVLGAYGFRGLFEKKAQFLLSIHQAGVSALDLLQQINRPELTYLAELLEKIVSDKRFQPSDKTGRLTVTVTSFSYKKGIPEDFTGNGGGFVFDCRALHNPGRYDRYKPLTGRDAEVIEFLEKDGGITDFLENCYALTDKAVDKYIERGFTSLMISFGCTGGRHRSVYSAQKMAEHIAACFDCDVILIHREQGIREEL